MPLGVFTQQKVLKTDCTHTDGTVLGFGCTSAYSTSPHTHIDTDPKALLQIESSGSNFPDIFLPKQLSAPSRLHTDTQAQASAGLRTGVKQVLLKF